jgi:hypothetical protein
VDCIEPARREMMFEQQPSCHTNRLFGDVVSQSGNLAIAELMACSATPIDESHRARHVTFLSDLPSTVAALVPIRAYQID